MKKLFAKVWMLPLLILLTLFTTSNAWAQWSVGASYEIRTANPKTGFGARIEKDIKLPIPLVSIVGRAHFSYFNANNKITQTGGYSYSTDFKDYDLGLTALGKVKLGVVNPYVGIGIGSDTYHVNIPDLGGGKTKNSIFYNATVGAEAALIPFIHPFVEYRISKRNFKDFNFEGNYKQQVDNSPGRLIMGISLQF
ncbi:MAG TPA: outer membrane beta-barrel protein [Balneolales bacterium]|nr:outer membrane beta-barrel protein [Balneolales bacterium]